MNGAAYIALQYIHQVWSWAGGSARGDRGGGAATWARPRAREGEGHTKLHFNGGRQPGSNCYSLVL